jgi:hypothetical protein
MWGEDNAKEGNKGLKRAIKIFNGISEKIAERPAQCRLQIIAIRMYYLFATVKNTCWVLPIMAVFWPLLICSPAILFFLGLKA